MHSVAPVSLDAQIVQRISVLSNAKSQGMLLLMPVLEIESRGMAKTKPAVHDTPRPDDDVRFVCHLKRNDRARLKYFCARIGVQMDDIAAQWLLERLDAEERKLSR